MVTEDQVVAYLEKNAPDIAKIVKNMTVGDVHQQTALGNEKDKKNEPSKFQALIAQSRANGEGKPEGETEEGKTAAWSIPLDIIKSQPDEQLIFGWASVVEVNGKLVIDKQGDIILPEDLEKAAYDFVLYSRSGGDMHTKKNVSRMVESMVFTKQKQDLMGIDLGMVGWWTGWRVDKPELWAAMKRGERPEFSIGGTGKRVEI